MNREQSPEMLFGTWRGGRGLVVATSAFLATAAIATWLVRLNGIPGRPLGVETGLPIAREAGARANRVPAEVP